MKLEYSSDSNPLIKQMSESMELWREYCDKYWGKPDKFIEDNQKQMESYINASKLMLAYLGVKVDK